MSLRSCIDASEATSLESSLGLYLKPISRVKINVQLPKLNNPGQSISSWHVMEKIKEFIRPDTFLYLKCMKITSAVIKFEGELETKAACDRALARLRAAGNVKLSGFADSLQIRAAHATCSGPTRHDWEAHFRDAKGVNEMKPGERPDTVKLEDVPVRWFAESGKLSTPSEKLLRKAFETFGRIRRIEMPPKASQSSETSMFGKTSSLYNDLLFEVYIQYEEYVEFAIAMESLRGKKLLYKDPDGKVFSADIKVDFDRTNYLSDKNIKKRAADLKKILIRAYTLDKNKSVSKEEALKAPPETKTKHLVLPVPVPKIESSSVSQKRATEAEFLLKELLRRAGDSEKLKDHQKKAVSSDSKKTKDESVHIKSQKNSVKDIKLLEHREKKSQNDSKKRYSRLKREVPSKNEKNKNEIKTPSVKTEKTHMKFSETDDKTSKMKRDNKSLPGKNELKSSGVSSSDSLKQHKIEKDMLLEEKKIKGRLIQALIRKKKDEEKLIEQEKLLKEKLLKNLRKRELRNREELRRELAGRNVLKSVVANTVSQSHGKKKS